MANFPRPQSLRRPGQNVLRNETVFIGLPRGNVSSSSSSSSNPTPPVNPPETVTYVAPNGSDATGERGNPLLPFATLSAAVNASLSGDSILVAPGSYTDSCIIPSEFSLSIIGLGQVEFVHPGPILTWLPAPGAPRRLLLRSLRLVATAANTSALVVNGTNSQEGHSVEVDDFFCKTPTTGMGLYVEQMDLVILNEGQADFQFHNCAQCYVNNVVSIYCTLSADNNLYSNNRVLVNGGLFLQIFQSDRSRVIYEGVTTEKLTANLTDDGTISFHGTSDDLFIKFGALTEANPVDISRSKIKRLVVDAKNSSPQTVDARGSEILEGLFSALDASAEAVLDTRGGSLNKESFNFIGANAAWDRLSDAVILTKVSPDTKISEKYENQGGQLPKAGWPTGTNVVYHFQVLTKPSNGTSTWVNINTSLTDAKKLEFEAKYPNVPIGEDIIFLIIHRVLGRKPTASEDPSED